ncbi:MAG: DUF2971 domain-containing protein [Anaerolineales bacterium]|nr:DUF2971 domain-containing protein [Anaerolineales bacterium]
MSKSVISEILNTKVNDLLFHYTSSLGLLGIIKSNKIWTTKIHYLNDKSEFQLAFGYIRNEIESQLKGIDKTRTDEELNIMLETLRSIGTVNVSVASFTQEGDQLSQWRGYCEVGDGYAIGFEGQKLMDHVNKSETHKLVPCVYKEDKHIQIVKELVNHAPVINIKNHPNYGKPPFNNMSFGEIALFLAPIIKSEGFREEQEWRLISSPLSYENAYFRKGNYSLVPYWEFDLDLVHTYHSIIIGPTPEKDLAELALQGFLHNSFFNNVTLWLDIKHSKIPFRKI